MAFLTQKSTHPTFDFSNIWWTKAVNNLISDESENNTDNDAKKSCGNKIASSIIFRFQKEWSKLVAGNDLRHHTTNAKTDTDHRNGWL
jgi:hypothetical protein